jgi:hypothetical protein
MSHLSDDVLEVGVGRVQAVHVGVHGELCERFPGRLVSVDVHGVEAQGRTLVPNCHEIAHVHIAYTTCCPV